jgi:hypothetical protein
VPDGIAGANNAVFLLWTSCADDDIDIGSIKSPLVDLPAGATSIGLDAEAIDGRNAEPDLMKSLSSSASLSESLRSRKLLSMAPSMTLSSFVINPRCGIGGKFRNARK